MAIVPADIRRARPLLGTFVEIAVQGTRQIDIEDAVEQAFDVVARVHRLMSFHDPDSDVSRLNLLAAFEAVSVDPWTYQVLQASIDIHRRSAGAFDIAIARVLQDMGRLPCHDRQPHSVSASGQSICAIELLPENMVRFQHSAVTIDLGGIAKGYAVDLAVERLKEFGVEAGVVNAGGDLAGFGPDPHVVDIRDPGHPGRILSRTAICNQALASSAGNIDPAGSLAVSALAIIDPVSQKPANRFDGVTVRASSCMIADALTKPVMLAGETAAALLQQYGAAAMLVRRDGAACVTENW